MMSILLRPDHDRLPPTKAHLATTALGVAAVDACRFVSGVEVGLKWPNDLTVEPRSGAVGGPGYRKVAGVLTESVVTDGQVQAMVCGIGLNTGWSTVPPELRDVAASLNLLSGHDVDRVVLAASILTGFEERYSSLLSAGSDDLMVEARRRSVTLGRRVRATSNSSAVEGVAVDLDEVGRLLIETDDGNTQRFDVGDIDHLRPVDM
jgi:BirA family biotin operon repressor/biotin-[acetyl-CoA-carboxylase] ligase